MISIDAKRWYPAHEAAKSLNVKVDTVKKYCRDRKVRGKKIGPKEQWHVLGQSIIYLRKKWDIDSIS